MLHSHLPSSCTAPTAPFMVQPPWTPQCAQLPVAPACQACEAMTAFNLLIAAVATDSEYLQRTLAPAAEYDDFLVGCRMMRICLQGA